jgi:PAS domain S-box-containing protein
VLQARLHAQRAEVRFRGLLEAAPDAVVCADADGQIVLVNAQTERLFGYRRDELIGQPAEILVPDAIKASHPAYRAGAAMRGSTHRSIAAGQAGRDHVRRKVIGPVLTAS